MTKILYDHQVFGWQKFGGISRYFVELMSRLPQDVTPTHSVVFTDNVYLRASNLPLSTKSYHPRFIGSYQINSVISKAAIRRKDFDLFHPTYYDPYFLGCLKKPYVITVHDMIHELFGDMFPFYDRTRSFKKKVITQARHIIAVSQKTKEDIISLYGLNEEKISVVYHGHSVNAATIEPIKDIPHRYLLFVGQRGRYKNFDRLVKAFAQISKREPDIKLICTGKPFHPNEQKLLQSLNIEDKVVHYFATDEQLACLYQNALCFVFPSLYEGFGIPILEAFAADCPLALSNTSCFPEIAQDGGAYFDPYDIDSIAAVLSDIIANESLRANLVMRGRDILSRYSWDKMAANTANIYKSIIQ